MSQTNTEFPVPASIETVQVRIIDSTSKIENLQVNLLMEPPIHGLEYLPALPSWSFLIEHPSGQKALFDLGVPKDWRSFPPASVGHIDQFGWEVTVEKEVIDVLGENGVSADQINSIIWR